MREFQKLSEAIEKAKEKVKRNFGVGTVERNWLEAYTDSYNDPKLRLTLLALEGSPAKGFIVINHGSKWVKGFDCGGKMICNYKSKEIPEF